MEKRRVLHVLLGTANGGGEVSFCRYLDRGRHENFSISVAAEGDGSTLLTATCNRHMVPILRIGLGLGLLSRLRACYQFLKSAKFDVIHVHSYYKGTLWLLLAKLVGIPVRVFHAHSANKPFLAGRYGSVITNLFYFAFDISLRIVSNRFYYVSGKARDELPLLGKSSSCKFHPPYTEAFDGTTLRSKRSFDFCFVGRIANHGMLGDTKGLKIFFDAMYFCLEQNQNLKIAVYGEGDALSYWRKQVESRGYSKNIIFFNFVGDIFSALCLTKVLVAPSQFEGFGLAVLEAQIAGTKVVCSEAFAAETNIANDNIVLSTSASIMEWGDACLKQVTKHEFVCSPVPLTCLPEANSYEYA